MNTRAIRIFISCLTLLGMAILTAPEVRAELPVWAPIDPTFIGGNPLMGQFLLNKAVATKEHDEDDPPGNPGSSSSNPSSSIGPAIDRMLDRLSNSLDRSLGNLDRSLSQPINLNLQGGSGNTTVFAPK